MELTKRLNYLVKTTLSGLLLSPLSLVGQSVDLETCYELAGQLSPLRQQEQYLQTVDALNHDINQSRLLPDLTLQGRASYQSDVFGLPFTLPTADVPQIPKDQYQLTVNLSQTIYDGGLTRATDQVDATGQRIQSAQLAVSLYQIKSIINEVYFGILTLEEQEKIFQNILKELDNQLGRASSAVANGLLLPSALKSLQKEKLSNMQKLNELRMRRIALLRILADWTGMELPPSTTLIWPEPEALEPDLNRLESAVFTNRMDQLKAKESLLSAQRAPKLGAFATAGYGSPNPYNFFEVDWNTFYLVGARIEWKPWDWNHTKKQREVLGISQQIIQTEKENFEKTINHQLMRQQGEIDLLEASLTTDKELLQLQQEITRAATAQFAQGVITATDYLSELNALAQSELQYSLHQLQLVKTKTEYQTLSGNMP